MTDEKAMYWLTQIVGWFLFILLILFQNVLAGSVDTGIWKFLVLNFAIGIGLSHLMRFIIVRCGMLKMKVASVLILGAVLSVLTAVVATLFIYLFQAYIFQYEQNIPLSWGVFVELVLPFMVVFLIWNILYFAANYLKNYEREEIKNLRLSASVTEVELMNLRTQLNPHFMFNALNSIRALIDENPGQAKKAVTQMSNILRSSLTSGRHQLIPLEAEIKVVNDYLELEKIRFEERLHYAFNIPSEMMKFKIPPLLLQTIVENAVKHGVGTQQNGGRIEISARLLSAEIFELSVFNTGKYSPNKHDTEDHTGIGLVNSRRRLKLLFGKKAHIELKNIAEGVACTVTLPVNSKIETHEEYTN